MNKGKFPHDRKQQKHQPSQGGNRPQWPNNPNQHPSHNPGQNPNRPQQWPGQKDKR